ncbi:MAG: hypothetical protein H7Z37_15320, partial [Pyrinomonadaceae bacterium]|nr:hypothetical protein [Pyrinomonadaceae bacterium]
MMSVTEPESNEYLNKPPKRPFYMGFLFFAAIIMPVAAFAVETTTRICADNFFDPMPTLFHVLLVLSVPLINLQTWFDVHNRNIKRLKILAFANGFVLFVSLAYSIIYAPLLPLAFIALIILLIGLLPMTPFFALIGTLLLRNELKKISGEAKPFALRLQGLTVSFATVLLLFTLAETPMILTRIGLEKAVSADTAERDNGLRFLRNFSNQDLILRECYEQTGRATFGFLGDFIENGNINNQSGNYIGAEQAREIFYRLYGESYRSLPTPRGVRNWERRWIENLEIGSDGVANRLNDGLSLTSSQMDGSVDGDAALGYLEWTVTFKNDKPFQQEAATTIQLPPNAVVSRLTLWINGEEREAAFAGRERVTQAYNSVTAQRRDPVLITTAGKDKISMRAFPVQPNGGEMKMRIGISSPLVVTNATESLLPLPRFITRNFAVSTEHAVWIESKKKLESANQNFVYDNKNGVSSVRGKISNADLSNIGSPIRALRTNGKNVAFAKFNANSGEIVRQEITETTNQKPSRLIFVVDANAKMKPYRAEIADAIENLPNEIETFSILTDGNGLNENIAAPKFASGAKAE